ncbi:MAG: response regulator [Acidimicrobiales bacterium]
MSTILIATDAGWVWDEVDAALADADTAVYRVRAGREVVEAVRRVRPELVVLDLQIGNMGGVAAALAVRQEQEMDRLPAAAILMLLDREADVFMAQTSGAEGWLIKPLDAFRIRRAAAALLAGGAWREGQGVEQSG